MFGLVRYRQTKPKRVAPEITLSEEQLAQNVRKSWQSVDKIFHSEAPVKTAIITGILYHCSKVDRKHFTKHWSSRNSELPACNGTDGFVSVFYSRCYHCDDLVSCVLIFFVH